MRLSSLLPYYAALVVAILIGAGGQLLLKTGALRGGAGFETQLLSPFTLGGLALYGVAALLYIVAIRRLPLTLAFPSVASSYILVAVAAHYLWREHFGWAQFAGILLIGIGIFVLHQN
jgi:small multidrug resistance pump